MNAGMHMSPNIHGPDELEQKQDEIEELTDLITNVIKLYASEHPGIQPPDAVQVLIAVSAVIAHDDNCDRATFLNLVKSIWDRCDFLRKQIQN